MQQLLRTPPRSRDEDRTYVTASWGSPYPKSESLDRLSSLSSASSADSSPGHHLEIQTPFLRLPPSLIEESPTEQNQPSFVSAAILANRARRPARGLTEDWIRQHTSAGDGSAEARHWLSDGAGDSENSSLSGSISGEEAAWFDESDLKTPRATTSAPRFPRSHQKYPRTRSSNETLKQADVQHLSGTTSATMASESEPISPEGLMATNVTEKALPEPPSTPKLSEATMTNGFANSPLAEKRLPQTPKKSPMKQPPPATPRLKKKVPWKGKNIMILLPRDGDRGKPGHAPLPLNEQDVAGIMKSWEELGYSTKGFHLDDTMGFIEAGNQSQSRREWPTWEDLASDRQQRNYKVTLPDLNGEFSLAYAYSKVIDLQILIVIAVQHGNLMWKNCKRQNYEPLESLLAMMTLRHRFRRHPSVANRLLRIIHLSPSRHLCQRLRRQAMEGFPFRHLSWVRVRRVLAFHPCHPRCLSMAGSLANPSRYRRELSI